MSESKAIARTVPITGPQQQQWIYAENGTYINAAHIVDIFEGNDDSGVLCADTLGNEQPLAIIDCGHVYAKAVAGEIIDLLSRGVVVIDAVVILECLKLEVEGEQ